MFIQFQQKKLNAIKLKKKLDRKSFLFEINQKYSTKGVYYE